MKITSYVPPVETKYSLDLTKSQLIALGLLSYRHEEVCEENSTFYRCLPGDIRDAVVFEASKTRTLKTASTDLKVNWNG